jgi:hypothetical protein
MGRYILHPVSHRCETLEDLRRFLAGCRFDSDMKKSGKEYRWMPPEEFEQKKIGICVDFSLWAWRQLMLMGYEARFGGGPCGRYGEGHAWVTFTDEKKHYLLEPQFARVGSTLPRLSVLQYKPEISVSWDGKKIRYFVHEERDLAPPFRELPGLVLEWARIWGAFWGKVLVRLPKVLFWTARKRWTRSE